MIENLLSVSFNVLLRIVFLVINFITIPIDAVINANMPNLGDAFANVGYYLNIVTQSLGWVISLSGIPPAMIALIGYFFIFKLTIPINIYFLKLAAKYWMTVKR